MRISSRQLRLLVLGALVASALLLVALRKVDMTALANTLLTANWLLCLPFVLGLFAHLYLKALRWRLLLGERFAGSGSSLLSPTVVGYAANLIVPHVGEISRTVFLNKKYGIPHAYTLATIGVERSFDLMTVACLVAIPISFSGDISEQLRAAIVSLVAVSAVLLIAAIGFSAAGSWLAASAERFLPHGAASAVGRLIRDCAEAVRNLRNRHLLVPIILLSVFQWLAVVCCVYLSLLAVGVSVTPIASFAVLGIIIAGLVLPSAPGYIGTIQFGFVMGLSLFGINAEPAVASSLFYNLWITAPALLWAGAAANRLLPDASARVESPAKRR